MYVYIYTWICICIHIDICVCIKIFHIDVCEHININAEPKSNEALEIQNENTRPNLSFSTQKRSTAPFWRNVTTTQIHAIFILHITKSKWGWALALPRRADQTFWQQYAAKKFDQQGTSRDSRAMRTVTSCVSSTNELGTYALAKNQLLPWREPFFRPKSSKSFEVVPSSLGSG